MLEKKGQRIEDFDAAIAAHSRPDGGGLVSSLAFTPLRDPQPEPTTRGTSRRTSRTPPAGP
jgi:hypothetical protein